MGREGHGRGAQARKGGERRDAARRSARTARQRHQPGPHEGAADMNMMTRWSLVLAFGAALTASTASAEPLTKVRMAYDGFSMTSAPLNYAVQQKIFQRFGLDI